MMTRLAIAKQSRSKGILIITDDFRLLVSHCSMFEDSLFFNAILDKKNASVLAKHKGEILGSLTIDLINS